MGFSGETRGYFRQSVDQVLTKKSIVGLNFIRFVRDGHNFRHSDGEGLINIEPPPARISATAGYLLKLHPLYLTKILGSNISKMAYRTPSLPRPESFTPPYGM